MTVVGAVGPDDKLVRMETGLGVIKQAHWFRIPYPGNISAYVIKELE